MVGMLGLVGGLVLVSTPASSQVSGKARVINGDTLKIGRQVVALFGIDAPETKQFLAYPRDSSCDEAAIGHRFGSCGAMDESRDHGPDLIAPVVAPGETGEVALGMIGAEFAIGPGDRALDIAERRIDPLE